MKKLSFTFLLFLIGKLLFAQPTADIELLVDSPFEGQIFNQGDTAFFNIQIINHGPDDLTLEDTIYIGTSMTPFTAYFYEEIKAKDSSEIKEWGYVINTSNNINQELTYCAFLFQPSMSILDNNALNDSACVTFNLSDNPSFINNILSKNIISLYPNPADESININTKDIMSKTFIVKIMDILGREVYNNKLINNYSVININLENWSSGMYVLILEDNETRLQGRFLKK